MVPRNTPALSSDVPGFTSDALLGFIYDCVVAQKPENCLEIGTFMGRSASVICQALSDVGGDHRLFCVDFYVQEYGPNYLNTPSKRHMINRCGPQVAALYTDFSKLKMLEDCFRLTVSRKPSMQKFVTLIRGNSAELELSTLPRIDFAYIDGDHSYEGVAIDTYKTLGRLNANGMIVFDDYIERFEGVMRFVDLFKQAPGVTFVGQQDGDIAFVVAEPAEVRSFLSSVR